MEFRRSGQRDDRRRRVLRDELLATSDETDEAAPARPRRSGGGALVAGRSYTDHALRERQPHVVDLLPTRGLSISICLLAALTAVAALVVGHLYLLELARLAGRENLAAFDLAATNSLATWFSSFVLTLAAAKGALIYSLRRHKADDYRGRYLVWLPATAALFFLSIDATANLVRPLAATIVRVSGSPNLGDVATWSVGLYGLLFGTLGLRLAVEMRRSRSATAAFAAATLMYGLSVPFCLGLWLPANAPLAQFGRGVWLLLGHVALVTSIGCYARYVFLDSQGRLAAKKPRASKAKKPAAETSEKKAAQAETAAGAKVGDKVRRIDAAHTDAPAPKAAPSPGGSPVVASRTGPLASKMPVAAGSGAATRFGDAAQAKAAATITRGASSEDFDDEDDDGDESGRLSKAERKRLKKLQRRGRV